ncbi:MAG: ABC transporter permease [Spirochaetaceae bacterium]|nr:MAG: ABC transporter permease [Spirochaetaceae bacterium]
MSDLTTLRTILDPTEAPDLPDESFELTQSDRTLTDVDFKTPAVGYFRDALQRFSQNKASVTAFVIICAIVFMAIFGPGMTPYGFNQQNVDLRNMPPRIPALARIGIATGHRTLERRRVEFLEDTERYPMGSIIELRNPTVISGVEVVDVVVDYYAYLGVTGSFWFGTDYLGRDYWTRLWRGARVSLVIAFVSVATNLIIGVIYGAVSGYYGGTVDMVLMRICEVIEAFPRVVVVTLFILFFGTGLFSIIMSLIISGWITTARLVRAQFYRFKLREFVLAARTMGVRDSVIMFRHVFPNSVGPIITRTMFAVPLAIFTESFLAYIGLGLQAPEPTIGVLLSDAQRVLLNYPYQSLFPAVVISALMISFNLFANGLRDALDPTMRGV